MERRPWRLSDSIYFALIGLAEFLVFFRNPGHFFMGDTVLWMGYRYRSIGEFLKGFIELDPTLWYRPVAQRTVESILYPLAGLNPVAYHLVIFVLFFACTAAVFRVTECLMESRRPAWMATVFFAFHVTHAVTTYDTAFVPEMVYTLFHVGAVLAFVRYMRTHNRTALALSVASFLGSLLSKETAVAVPFTLVAVWLLLPLPDGTRPRLRSLVPHFAILAVYLVLMVGVLHIRAIDVKQLMESPGTAGQSSYQLVLGKNVLETTAHAFTWAFGISRGIYGQWRPDVTQSAGYDLHHELKVIRFLICVAALLAMFTPQRRFILIGLAWFLFLAGPTLPLLNHFLPYYLFGPLVGFSLAVGAALDWAYRKISGISTPLAFVLCALLLLVPAAITAATVDGIASSYMLCGNSSHQAFAHLTDMQTLHPNLPKGIKLLVFDEENVGTSWNEGRGMLYQMAYGDDSLKIEYLTDGVPISVTEQEIHDGSALAFKLAEGHFVDVTSLVKQRPELLKSHNLSQNYHLKLSKDVVRSGDSYIAQIPELKGATVHVLRAFNGVVEEPFDVKLDDFGQVEFKVGSETKPGDYSFVAVQRNGEPGWVIVHGTVRVEAP